MNEFLVCQKTQLCTFLTKVTLKVLSLGSPICIKESSSFVCSGQPVHSCLKTGISVTADTSLFTCDKAKYIIMGMIKNYLVYCMRSWEVQVVCFVMVIIHNYNSEVDVCSNVFSANKKIRLIIFLLLNDFLLISIGHLCRNFWGQKVQKIFLGKVELLKKSSVCKWEHSISLPPPELLLARRDSNFLL